MRCTAHTHTHTLTHTHLDRGVMVTFVGSRHGDPSSNPERGCLYFILVVGKGMDPILLSQAMDK